MLTMSIARRDECAARPGRALGLACALIVSLIVAAPAASAASAPASFALQPLGGSEHPGYFVLNARPGMTLTRAIRLVNTGGRTGTAALYGVDATTGQTTGAVYLSQMDPRRDAGAWIRLRSDRLTLAPKQSRTISFTIVVPRTAGAGQHLGGVVAENVALTRGPTRKQGNGSFRINVQTLSIIAVELNLPGLAVQRMSLTGVNPGGANGQQSLLVNMRNDGNQLLKGEGELTIRNVHGLIKDVRFPIDTFVPHTHVADPVPLPGRGLGAGRYEAIVTLRYGHAHQTHLSTTFTISSHEVAQVYRASPHQAPFAQRSGSRVPLLALILGALVLILASFFAAVLLMRRRVGLHGQLDHS
jgi:hypothetical protein